MGGDSSQARTDWLRKENQHLRMDSPPGQDWGAVFITVGTPKAPPRPFQDFSTFEAVAIALRGEIGGEELEVGIKSNEQPDDGSETKLKVKLTPEWKVYRFALTRFVGADLQRLYVPLEF